MVFLYLLYCNLCTREPIFNLKMFSSLRISNRVKYGVGFSLLCAKKMQRKQKHLEFTYLGYFKAFLLSAGLSHIDINASITC